jgi:catechol 2,3-dioxygenase-like lactoylglutathione lyase family enzyme
MPVQLAKSAIDLGIVIQESERSLEFYVGLLGLEHVGDMPMPIGGGGTMHRLQCGDTVIKLVNLTTTPAPATPGGIAGGLGLRYLTLIVSNLDEILAECAAADVNVVVPASEIRPGLRIGMVEDPDGNWVEFVEAA